jgi:hypothetical protein
LKATIATYIWIPKNVPLVAGKGRKVKAKSDDDFLKKGPFMLHASDTFQTFLTKLAAALPCRPENIHQGKITWKPVKPLNAVPLPLGGVEGYKVMVNGATARKPAESMLVLQMPAPIRGTDGMRKREMVGRNKERSKADPCRLSGC